MVIALVLTGYRKSLTWQETTGRLSCALFTLQLQLLDLQLTWMFMRMFIRSSLVMKVSRCVMSLHPSRVSCQQIHVQAQVL